MRTSTLLHTLFTVGLIGAGVTACSSAPGVSGTGKVLVTVGDQTITEGDLELLTQVGPPQVRQQLALPGGKRQIINTLVERELLYKASHDAKLDTAPDVQTQIALHTRSLIAQAALTRRTDTAAQEYYDANRQEFETVPLAHILIKTGAIPPPPGTTSLDRMVKKTPSSRSEADALALANQLKDTIAAGQPFAQTAKEQSDDAATRNNGGSLGQVWRKEPRLMRQGYEELLNAAFGAAPNTVVGPIKTASGYHLIQVGAAPALRAFDDVKPMLTQRLSGKIREEYLATLRNDTRVVYVDPTLAPSAPAKPAAQPATLPAGHSEHDGHKH